jgi:hypothetical protein
MKIPWIVITNCRILIFTVVIIVRSSARMKVHLMISYGRLHKRRLTYALLFLAEAVVLALLGEADLLFMVEVALTLVGEAVFILAATLALAGVDFAGDTTSFLVVEGATHGFFGLS